MKIAIYQGYGVGGDVAKALAVMRRVVAEAAVAGARLVVFPELFLTGYHMGGEGRRLAETAAGDAAGQIAAMAAEAGAAVLYGCPEREGEVVYNAARLLDRQGHVAAIYRKTHLYGPDEKRLFRPGSRLVAADVEGLRVGILVCYDVEFPEAVRALALAGVDLVAVPTALVRPFDIVARTLVPARAFENQVFVAYAGLCGFEGGLGYCGLSCVIGPDGRELARAGRRPALLVAEVDIAAPAASRRLNPYLTDRRPELYASPVARPDN
jgi:predicted amidohydrolase